MQRPVILIGGRLEAAKACERLGLEAAVVAHPGLTRSVRHHARAAAEVPLDGPPEAVVAAAAGLLAGRAPAGVLAVTEAAVEPAAHVRAALALPGLSVGDARACRYKPLMKERFAAAGVPCEPTRPVDGPEAALRLARTLGFPLFVKAVAGAGGRGGRVAADEGAVVDAVRALEASGAGAALERLVVGREHSVELFLEDGAVRLANVTEYVASGRINLLPAPLPEGERAAATGLAVRAANAVGLARGMAHVELYRVAHGWMVGEIAARPPGGRLMDLLHRVWGFDPWEAFVRLAIGDPRTSWPAAPQQAAGNVFFHPGPGRVLAVDGWEAATALPGACEGRLRAGPGAVLTERVGTGQFAAHLTVVGADSDAVRATLLEADRRVAWRLAPSP